MRFIVSLRKSTVAAAQLGIKLVDPVRHALEVKPAEEALKPRCVVIIGARLIFGYAARVGVPASFEYSFLILGQQREDAPYAARLGGGADDACRGFVERVHRAVRLADKLAAYEQVKDGVADEGIKKELNAP